MRRPNSRAVSRAEVQQLLHQVTRSMRDDLMSKRCLCDVYKLPSGSALLVLADGKGRWYDSYQEMEAFLDEKTTSGFQDVLPQQKHFIEEVENLLGQLPRLIGVAEGELDLTESSLAIVDRALRHVDESEVLTPEVFPALLAYVGEVIRRRIDGEWQIREQADGTWEPDIVDKRGRQCGLLRIYKELMEYGEKASLAAFAFVRIRNQNRWS
jgi:hypothetical protein